MAGKRPSDLSGENLSFCSHPKQVQCRVDRCTSPAGHIHETFNSERAYVCLGGLTPLLDQKFKHSSMEGMNEKSETDITIFLANHFFGKLSLTSKYVIDGQSKGKRKGNACSCSQDGCKMTGVFGDTSIGNAEVWHGKVDVLLNHTDIALKIASEEHAGDKRRTSSIRLKDEIFAETIVFSFLQKQFHPYRGHHLYPCIAVNNSDQVVYFYDSHQDVLLESSPVPLFDRETGKFQFATIILAWLVVNHKCLCDGLPSDLACKKSGFFECKKIDVFREDLHLGQVVFPAKSPSECNGVKQLCKEVDDLNKRRLRAMANKSFE
ncbi:uncharacterized protein LOC110448198 isoform X2 [Mizuhopecten yessoensis]|uniref:Uncharacterized protein n=1 Tax=Mizuhopecten yessoensis TaxID=6573 RepID=A0A210QTT5_MIZYE|nr:uncharacterized protein LOC110448198 isoform X2 [Mizuhopecten yessoensis]OWF52112.1 hypothetical protein KP79_PYT23033 [Mizuhopecten yessoensis]